MMIMKMIIIKVTVKNHEQERAHGNEAVSGKVRVKVWHRSPRTMHPPKHPPIGPEATQGPIGPVFCLLYLKNAGSIYVESSKALSSKRGPIFRNLNLLQAILQNIIY